MFKMKIKYCRNSKHYIIYTIVLLFAVTHLPWANGQSGDGGDFDPFPDEEDRHGSASSIIDKELFSTSSSSNSDNNNNHHHHDHHHEHSVSSNSDKNQSEEDLFANPNLNPSKPHSESGTTSTSPPAVAVLNANPNVDHEQKVAGDDLFIDEDDRNGTDRQNATVEIVSRDEESSLFSKSGSGSIALVVVGSLVLILICFIWRVLCLRKKRRKAKLRRIALSNQILGNDKSQARELMEIKRNFGNGQDTYGVISKPTVIAIDEDELQPMMVSSNYPRSEKEQLQQQQEKEIPTAPPKESHSHAHVNNDDQQRASSKSPLQNILHSRPQLVTTSLNTTKATIEQVHLPTKDPTRPASPPPSYEEYISTSNDQLNKNRDSVLSDLGPSYR